MNNFTGAGRLTRDPKIIPTSTDAAMCAITIAVDRPFKNARGEKVTDFIDAVAWRQQADFLIKYCRKGDPIAIKGELHSRRRPDKDGTTKTVHEIEVAQVESFAKRRPEDTYMGDDSAEPDGDAGAFFPVAEDDTPLPFSL